MAELLDDLPMATVVVGPDRLITSANQPAALLTGRPLSELVGTCLDDLVLRHDGEVPGWHPSVALRSVTAMPDCEITLRLPDGSTTPAVVCGRYCRDDDGRLTSAVLIIRTARHRGHRAPSGIEIVSTVS